jgi:hypothetical protein
MRAINLTQSFDQRKFFIRLNQDTIKRTGAHSNICSPILGRPFEIGFARTDNFLDSKLINIVSRNFRLCLFDY